MRDLKNQWVLNIFPSRFKVDFIVIFVSTEVSSVHMAFSQVGFNPFYKTDVHIIIMRLNIVPNLRHRSCIREI